LTSPASVQPKTVDWYEQDNLVRRGPGYRCDIHSTAAKKNYARLLWRSRQTTRPRMLSWHLEKKQRYAQMFSRLLGEMGCPEVPVAETVTVEARFRRLADDWSRDTIHISSVSDLINDRRYQEIIGLDWDVVPYLLKDLQQNKRFWFPALAAITGVRPFDSGDASNPRRMTQAWVKWGKRKGLI
jgi:hypothetical protein